VACYAALLLPMRWRGGNSSLVAAYVGNSDRFDRVMVDFSAAYAGQVERDHARFRDLRA